MSKVFGAARNLQSRLQEDQRLTMDWLVDDKLIARAGLSVAYSAGTRIYQPTVEG